MTDKKEDYYFSLNPADDNNPPLFITGQPPESDAKQETPQKPSFVRDRRAEESKPAEEKTEIILEKPKEITKQSEIKEKQIKLTEVEEIHTESPKKFESDGSGSRKIRVLFTASILTCLLMFLFLFASPSMTSISREGEIQPMATYAAKIDYALMNDDSFSFDLNNSDYNLEDAKAMSLGLSGAVIGEGTVRVYMVDENGKEYALYDNEVESGDKLFKLNGITGMGTDEEVTAQDIVADAQAYADAAMTSANAAQTSADNAKASADDAQSMSDDTQSIYSQVLIEAQKVGSAANSPKSKAGIAANEARNKAILSREAANNAQDKAILSLEAASQAQEYANTVETTPGNLYKAENSANTARSKADSAYSYEITAQEKEEIVESFKNEAQGYLTQILAMLPPVNPPVNDTQPPENETQPSENETIPPVNPPVNDTQPPTNQTTTPPKNNTTNLPSNQSTKTPQKPVITNQTPQQIKQEQRKAETAAKEAAKLKRNECKNCKSLNDIIKKNNEINNTNNTATNDNFKGAIQEELKDTDYNLIIMKVKETEITNLNLPAQEVITTTETANGDKKTVTRTISGGAIELTPEEEVKVVAVEEKINEIPLTIKKFEYSCVDTCYTKIKSGKYTLKVQITGKAAVWLNRLIVEA